MIDVEARTPLHWAAISGRTDIVTLLTRSKASIDAFDQRGESVRGLVGGRVAGRGGY